MRHISYNMELDDHYTITNTQDFEYDRHANSGEYSEDGPSIRVVFEKSENSERFLNDFEFADLDGTLDPYIEQHWRDILNGNDTFWKLTRIQVSLNFIWLEFFNKALHDAWLDVSIDDKDVMPSYNAAITQEGSMIWTSSISG